MWMVQCSSSHCPLHKPFPSFSSLCLLGALAPVIGTIKSDSIYFSASFRTLFEVLLKEPSPWFSLGEGRACWGFGSPISINKRECLLSTLLLRLHLGKSFLFFMSTVRLYSSEMVHYLFAFLVNGLLCSKCFK